MKLRNNALKTDFLVLALFLCIHTALCFFDCVEITHTSLVMDRLPEVWVERTSMMPKFVLCMAAIRLVLLLLNARAARVCGLLLTLLVSIATSSYLFVLGLGSMTGGLYATDYGFTTIGIIANTLTWVIAVLQLLLLIWEYKTIRQEYLQVTATREVSQIPGLQPQPSRKKLSPWAWIIPVVLILLAIVIFRDMLISWIKELLFG